MKSRSIRLIGVTGLILTGILGASCGKNKDSIKNSDGSPPVAGELMIGTQCPYGTIQDPAPASLLLWECPIQVTELGFQKFLPPILVSADCKKKTLAIRTADSAGSSIDTSWYVMPNGSFYVTIDGGSLVLKDDGAGTQNCTTPISLDFRGQLNCQDRDRIDLNLSDITIWLNKEPENQAANANRPPLTGPRCNIPKSCYLQTAVRLPQCG